jgi:hypothetical protein
MNTESKLKKLVDQAGEAQKKAKEANDNYRTIREKIVKVIEDNDLLVTTQVSYLITGKKYEGDYRYDDYEYIDPIDFLKEIESKSLRRKLMVVPITMARKELPKSSLKKLITIDNSDKPILHISVKGAHNKHKGEE